MFSLTRKSINYNNSIPYGMLFLFLAALLILSGCASTSAGRETAVPKQDSQVILDTYLNHTASALMPAGGPINVYFNTGGGMSPLLRIADASLPDEAGGRLASLLRRTEYAAVSANLVLKKENPSIEPVELLLGGRFPSVPIVWGLFFNRDWKRDDTRWWQSETQNLRMQIVGNRNILIDFPPYGASVKSTDIALEEPSNWQIHDDIIREIFRDVPPDILTSGYFLGSAGANMLAGILPAGLGGVFSADIIAGGYPVHSDESEAVILKVKAAVVPQAGKSANALSSMLRLMILRSRRDPSVQGTMKDIFSTISIIPSDSNILFVSFELPLPGTDKEETAKESE